LIAGTNITISDNVISASGGGEPLDAIFKSGEKVKDVNYLGESNLTAIKSNAADIANTIIKVETNRINIDTNKVDIATNSTTINQVITELHNAVLFIYKGDYESGVTYKAGDIVSNTLLL
jgi:phosphotransferase system IIA component